MAELFPLGRRIPDDFEHVQKYPFSLVAPATVATVEKLLKLPSWHWSHDQGREGSCVGHGIVMERAITNRAQNVLLALLGPSRRYNPLHVWNEGKLLDEWAETNPGDNNGTSVRAGYEVPLTMGLCRVRSMKLDSQLTPHAVGEKPVNLAEGVAAYRWATTVDEIRTAIAAGLPVTIGVDWMEGFDVDRLRKIGNEWWLPHPGAAVGNVRGGHCVCLYAASDRREAFKVKNSWGRSYPLAWMPYETMGMLLPRGGEAALVTDL